jgi:hypothetical protein
MKKVSFNLAGKYFLESLFNPKFVKMKLNRPPVKRSMNIVNHNKSNNRNSNVRVRRIMYDESKDGEVYFKLAGINVINMGGLYRHLVGAVGNTYDFGNGKISNPLPVANDVYYKGNINHVFIFYIDI